MLMKRRSCEYKVGDIVSLNAKMARDIVFQIVRTGDGKRSKYRKCDITVIKGTGLIMVGNTYTVYEHELELIPNKCMFAHRMDGLDIGGKHGNS